MKNKLSKSLFLGFFSIVFSLSFLLLLASCNIKNKNEDNKPTTFTMYTSDLTDSMPFDDPVAREITKRTGVILDLQYPKRSNADSISLMLVNNSYPDLIFVKNDLARFIKNKAVIPLDDYIEKYGQNMKKLYGSEIVKLRYSLEDSSIYNVGTYELKRTINELSGNMQLQNAVLKEFGYPKVTTLEDYENIMQAYINKYPEINGHKTIGLSLLTDDWYWYVGLSNPGNYVLGLPDDGQWIVNQDTFESTYKFLYPEMKIFYKWLNKIYHKGLLDPESFTQTHDMWKNKLSGGYVLGTTYAYWGLTEIKKELENSGMTERTLAYLPVTAGKSYMDPSLKDYGYSGGWGIAISVDCKDPVKAFKFLDWMCSEEAQILTNWGFEGIDYLYDSQGKRYSITVSSKQNGVGQWLYPFPQGGTGYLDSTGNPLGKSQRETVIAEYNYAEKETLKAYGAEIWTELFPQPDDLGVSKHGQIWQYPLNAKSTAIIDNADAFVKSSLIEMILGPEGDFDAAWEKMQTELRKMGVEEVGLEVTELIKSKKELWSLP